MLEPDYPHEVKGRVRTKITYPTLDASSEESALCRNYFNKAVIDLVEMAKKNGGDGIKNIQTVTLELNGRMKVHNTVECSDEGSEGQVLATALVIRKKDPSPTAASSAIVVPDLERK